MDWSPVPHGSQFARPILTVTVSLILHSQADLDNEPLLKGRLISLTRVDGHARWVSNAVLQLIAKDLPTQVPGGLIVRDEDGAPTGAFH